MGHDDHKVTKDGDISQPSTTDGAMTNIEDTKDGAMTTIRDTKDGDTNHPSTKDGATMSISSIPNLESLHESKVCELDEAAVLHEDVLWL